MWLHNSVRQQWAGQSSFTLPAITCYMHSAESLITTISPTHQHNESPSPRELYNTPQPSLDKTTDVLAQMDNWETAESRQDHNLK